MYRASFSFCNLIILVLTFSANIYAEWDHRGQASLQWRQFESDDKPISEDTGMLVFTRVESTYTDDTFKHVFRGFARVDQKDHDRDFMALEDVYFSALFGEDQSWQVLAGYKLFNWTATEAFHPADVINSRNFDSDIEFFEKKGEPTVQVKKFTDWGTISAFLWPRFEAPQFPGNRSRLGYGFDFSKPQAISGQEVGDQWQFQGGLRLTYLLDDGDLSFHAIHHVDRNFPVTGTTDYTYSSLLNQNIPNDQTSFSNNPTPYYFKKTQFGGTLQYALSRLLVKVEGAYRIFEDDLEVLTAQGLQGPIDHAEAALGLEYTLDINGQGDSTLFFEVGSILGTTEAERYRLGAFQRDMFLGYRYAFNDIMGSELFLSLIHDLERENERLYNVSYARRLSDFWKLQTGLRIYEAPQKGANPQGLEVLDGAHHIYLNLTRYF